MDYRYLVQEGLKSWDPMSDTCPFCAEFFADSTDNDGCGTCPLWVDTNKSCLTMVLGGVTYNEDAAHPNYIASCIAFYKEWLETGVMPHVEYREG